MAIHGVKVNDKELQKLVDNILAQHVRKVEKASKEVLQIRVSNAIQTWYRYNSENGHHYSSIENSLVTFTEQITQDRNFVYIDISAAIDSGLYRFYTSHYSIYRESYVNDMSEETKLQLTFGQQWYDGVIGLPPVDRNGKRWPHIDAKDSLKNFIIDDLKATWDSPGTKRMISLRTKR